MKKMLVVSFFACLFLTGIVSASELVEMPREMQVREYVSYGNRGLPCDYPISMKVLERGEKYIIAETWCKKHIYKNTCHDKEPKCSLEQRKRK